MNCASNSSVYWSSRSLTYTGNIRSGSVCLDVINQTWSPMFGASSNISSCRPISSRRGLSVTVDMMNIFEVFLPQLLRYPNPNDPLNGEAAALLMRHPQDYEGKVKGAFHLVVYAP